VRTLLALALIAGLQSCGTTPGGGLEHLNLPTRTDTRPFSHVVVAGDTVYVAGTLGLDPETGQPPADAAEEARLVMDGIRAKLQLAGLDMGDLVQVQVFCPDTSLYETFNEVYASYFDGDYPVRAFIGSGPLLRGCRFEVNGIAAR
jgi:enamine deaminase RidA (YjgF/YER057c/UK114 family)